MRRTGALLAVAVTVALAGAGAVVAGLYLDRPAPASGGGGVVSSSAPSQSSTPSPAPPQLAGFAAAQALLAKQPGYMGLVIRDRHTGAVWKAGQTTRLVWAASTPKLAMATALLERSRANQVSLDDAARGDIAAMLASSDNDAAERLWDRYGKTSFLTRFKGTYGMKTATFVSGFPKRWGFIKCSAEDLAALMSYILDKLNVDDRAYLMDAMRGVQPIQQWGVYSVGPALRPGVKNGWSVEKDGGVDHWVIDTVGFLGDGERYVVAAMYHLPPKTGTINAGVHAVSDVVATAFGSPVPAPAVVPDRD